MTRKTKLGLMAAALLGLVALAWFALYATTPVAGSFAPDHDAGAASPVAAASDASLRSSPESGRSRVTSSPADTRPGTWFGALLVHVVWANDKAPAPQVNVRVLERVPDPYAFPISGVTAADGTVRFPRVRAGNATVTLDREGYGKTKIEPGAEAELTIELKPGVDASGVVVDHTGAPVAGAEVCLLQGFSGHAQVVAAADREGRFMVRGIGWAQWIGARAPGYAPSPVQQLGSAGVGAKVELRLVLPGRGGSVAGRVLDPDGKPLDGAVVHVGCADPTRTGQSGGLAAARCDAQGRYHVRCLAAGTNDVYARAEGYALWRGAVEVFADVECQLDVHVATGATFAGTVLANDRQPVRDAEIQVGAYGTPLGYRAKTAVDGSFRIEHMMTGEIEATISSDEHGRAAQKLFASDGQELRWDYVFPPSVTIRGRVVDEVGQPLAGWWVRAEDQEAVRQDFDHGTATTGADGRFVVAKMHERKHRLEVHEKGSSMPALALQGVRPSDGEVLLRVGSERRATVRIVGVLEDSEGKPCIGATLTPQEPSIRSGIVESLKDGTGRFALGPYPPGEWALYVHVPNQPDLGLGPRQLGPGETWDLGVVRLQTAGTLAVTIDRAAGVAKDATVSLRVFRDGRYQRCDVATAREDSRSGPLWPGDYTLQCYGPAVASDVVPFTIRASECTSITVHARAGAAHKLQVLEAEPDPTISTAALVIKDRGGRSVHAAPLWRSDDKPFETSVVLVAGSYSLLVTTRTKRAEGTLVVEGLAPPPEPIVLTLR